MITVVAAVIERSDRRLLIGQRRRSDTSPLKWEFPGGKLRDGETPEVALARELQEELGATLLKSVEIGRVRHLFLHSPWSRRSCARSTFHISRAPLISGGPGVFSNSSLIT